uniref:FAM86 N-terminal domain-containing protein n=1 Tax=Periophthalmus magnuspinnatus TaxID=409849 RepID=A0A3B3ZV74_9GOBI
SSNSTEVISQILNQTCCHPLCSDFPPSAQYRRLFLSELIKQVRTVAQVIGAAETSHCYKSYFLPGGGAVTLQENVAVISEGTTGLVTWEAALHLAEWALENQQYFTNRSVLELGSGAGFTGITICCSLAPSSFIFSDCHPKVLHKLSENIALNQLDPQVRVEELDWSCVTEEQLRAVGADTVMAADVVYDPVVVEMLVSLLCRIFAISSPDVFICSTVRNTDTYRGFVQRLGELHHEKHKSQIKIIKLYKK